MLHIEFNFYREINKESNREYKNIESLGDAHKTRFTKAEAKLNGFSFSTTILKRRLFCSINLKKAWTRGGPIEFKGIQMNTHSF
jgi:hypothetical protein